MRDLDVFLEAVATWNCSTTARTREALHPILAGIGERRDTAPASSRADRPCIAGQNALMYPHAATNRTITVADIG